MLTKTNSDSRITQTKASERNPLAMILKGLFLVGAIGSLVLISRGNQSEESTEVMGDLTSARRRAASDCPEGYKKAAWTTYYSYPCCCGVGSTNYVNTCSQTECAGFNGCHWAGAFSYSGHKTHDWLKTNGVVAFYSNKKVTGEANSDFKNKKLKVCTTSSCGTTFEVTALDTCSDDDCPVCKDTNGNVGEGEICDREGAKVVGGCCSWNAKKGDGYLIDMEVETLAANFANHCSTTNCRTSGDAYTPEDTICWKLA